MDIVVSELNKCYNEKNVLKEYNEIFEEGKVSFVMGPSGIGKTTLLKILVGLEKADGGKVLGLENKKISVVLQEDSLCNNLSLLSNIKLVCKNVDIEVIKYNLILLGLEGCLYKRVSELSGGMKRRVAILRAMMYDFDILIMDEPFKGLDTETKEQVINFIKKYIINKTVIIITHESENVNYFENSTVINMGSDKYSDI